MIAYGYWRQKLVSDPRRNPMKTYRREKILGRSNMPEAKMDDTHVSLRQLIDDNDRRINDLLAEKEHRINNADGCRPDADWAGPMVRGGPSDKPVLPSAIQWQNGPNRFS